MVSSVYVTDRITRHHLLLLCALLYVVAYLPGATAVMALRSQAQARLMRWNQLEEVFLQGTLEEGIPEGYSYGHVMLDPNFPLPMNVRGFVFSTFWCEDVSPI